MGLSTVTRKDTNNSTAEWYIFKIVIYMHKVFNEKTIYLYNIIYAGWRLYPWADWAIVDSGNGPLTRKVKLQVAHAPGMPGTFSSAADFKGNR